MQPATVAFPALTRFANAAWIFSQRNSRFVLVAMLAMLHVAVFRGVSDPWARGMLLAHLGLLLLMQPFLRAEQRLSPGHSLGLAALGVVVMLWLNWWLLALWVVVLSGLVAGRVYQQHAKWQRRSFLVVLGYLLLLLAIVILPEIAPRSEIGPEVHAAAEFGLPLLFAVLAVMPADAEPPDAAQVIDLFYSVFVMLLLVVLILGSFTFMTLGRIPYLLALAYTMFLIGGTLLLIALAWDTRPGFAGLRVFFSRYLLSIGLPVERWLRFLTELQQLEARPARFLSEGVLALAGLPWVAGAAWRAGADSGKSGVETRYAVEFSNSEVVLQIFSRHRMSPALHWHLHLLGQLLAEFYLAKVREEKLREARYLQAVHETGARMTHDIKNLLQSLNVLCSVATRQQGEPGELLALLRRQLPAVAQRLTQTLERLERPRDQLEAEVDARTWWDGLARQYRPEGVEFAEPRLAPGARVPQSLFNSVADNLIRNALAKRVEQPGLRVRASMEHAEGGLIFRLEDSGSPVPAGVEAKLFEAPVASAYGLGIGLYQAARQAGSAGYRLALESNREGDVRFALRPAVAEPAAS
jgi:hypothetical protein